MAMRDPASAMIEKTGTTIPATTAEALLRGQRLLVLSPHPDDESLGCGALLTDAFNGPGAHVVCLTDGSASHPGSRAWPPERIAVLRQAELVTAIEYLGGTGDDLTWFGATDAALHPEHASLASLTTLARTGGFGLLLAPSPLDPHCDHVAGAEIGIWLKAQVPHLRLGFYPIWSRWHGGGIAPQPVGTFSVRLPSGPATDQKSTAIAAHRSQAGLVVTDAPDGFEMPQGFADFFARQDEVYFLAAEETCNERCMRDPA